MILDASVCIRSVFVGCSASVGRSHHVPRHRIEASIAKSSPVMSDAAGDVLDGGTTKSKGTAELDLNRDVRR